MKTYIQYIAENTNPHSFYNGFVIMKHTDVPPGGEGMWEVPLLKYREFGNKINTGIRTVSLTQARDAIDKWKDFNDKLKELK